VLIHPWDEASREEWQNLLRRADFGQLITSGHHDGYPLVVPSHFVYDGADQIWLHLARPNPVWPVIEADPRVVFALIADHTYVEAAWNADEGVPPEHGVPTSYFTGVQFQCRAEIVDSVEGKFEILTRQLARMEPPTSDREAPTERIETDRRLMPGIRGLRLSIESVRAKMKYGGNKPLDKQREIAEHLRSRKGPFDAEARSHLLRRAGLDG
jgi:transcriptional regulator